MNLRLRPLFLLAVVFAAPLTFGADDPNAATRSVVHLLDYIAQDYAGAVKDGRVISEEEYGEMREFSRTALDAVAESPELRAIADLQQKMQRLEQLVEAKSAVEVVAAAAREAKQQIIEQTHLPVAPRRWPDLARGETLYRQACAACHGVTGRGDGAAAAEMQPPPANLRDEARMKMLTPFGAFNTIRLGVAGTAMPAFGPLSDNDTWALAFYSVSLRYDATPITSAEPPVSLDVAASQSDEQLESRLRGAVQDRRAALAAIRRFAPDTSDSLTLARTLLHESEEAYRQGDRETARTKALAAYLDGIEPLEARLRVAAPPLVTELEQRMTGVRAAIDSREPAATVERAVREADRSIAKARRTLAAPRKASAPFIVSMAAAIVLREAFEAILIVVAILSVLRSVGAGHATRWVHAGWIAALLIGVVAWFASSALLASSSIHRELLEAITSILAVLVLMYMGFWLHRRTEIAKWRAFVEGQVNVALGTGRLFGLAAISFFAVFREVLETVLFLIALSVEGGEAGRAYMLTGVIGALVTSIILAWLLVRFSARLPLRKMFTTTAVLMMALAVILAGKGLHALQEAGVSGVTPLRLAPTVDLFGVYPTLQTVAAQLLTIAVAAILWYRAQPRRAAA